MSRSLYDDLAMVIIIENSGSVRQLVEKAKTYHGFSPYQQLLILEHLKEFLLEATEENVYEIVSKYPRLLTLDVMNITVRRASDLCFEKISEAYHAFGEDFRSVALELFTVNGHLKLHMARGKFVWRVSTADPGTLVLHAYH